MAFPARWPHNTKVPITLANQPFFGGDSWRYDFWIFLLAIVGLGIAVGALWVAVVQIRKTRKAADAALEAVKAATDEISKIRAVVDLSQLCQLARELITLLREGNLSAATIRALDLRIGIAQVRLSPPGKRLLSSPRWQAMITEVSTIQEMLEEEGHGTLRDGFPRQRSLATMSEIFEQLNSLAASSAVAATGGK